MKALFGIFLCVSSSYLFAQDETNWWIAGDSVFIDFNGVNPSHTYTSNARIYETCATISDEFGNLLFYTDGDTIWGNTNSILTNGDGVGAGSGAYATNSTTQGSLFLKKINHPDQYYLFSLSSGFFHEKRLEFALIDRVSQSVLTKHNLLYSDTLTEKMSLTEHCNNKNYWLVVVNAEQIEPGTTVQYKTEFLSFLITESGIHSVPVKSTLDLPHPAQFLGQMKFSSKGDKLAMADGTGISLFFFNKETGEVASDQRIDLPLQNGYGLEFSPNDRFLYINEKQYDLQTGVLTSLLDYDCPSHLQRASDGKIYKLHLPEQEIAGVTEDNNWGVSGNINQSFRLTQIANPDTPGIGCDYDTTFIYDFHPGYNGMSIGLPHFPSFYFHHPKGEFSYTGSCVDDITNFFLTSVEPTIDSVQWHFSDDESTLTGFTVNHVFTSAGTWQVASIVYINGIADTTFQCVSVCGENSIDLPNLLSICPGETIMLNAANVCSLSYDWNTGDTVSAIQVTQPGMYVLQSNTVCGAVVDSVIVQEGDCAPLVEIPNIFTPNDDLTNDTFSIRVKYGSSVSSVIMNRWGNVVSVNDQQIPVSSLNTWHTLPIWDGKDASGVACSEGVYFYKITVTDPAGNIALKTGSFHLFQ